MERLLGICQGYSLECRIWEGEYSPDAHLEHQLTLLRDFIDEPFDWIVLAGVDELQEWPTDNINKYLTDENTKTGVTFYMGEYVDRVSPTGKLTGVIPVGIYRSTPSLFAQYPHRCVPIDEKGRKATRKKVIAFKAYLRAARSRQRIVIPDAAKSYFSDCEQGRLCPRGSIDYMDMRRNMFNLTPYSWFENRYRYIGSPKRPREEKKLEKWFWPYKVNPPQRGGPVYVHQFKWHAEAVNQTRDKLERYSGTCSLERNVPGCRPLLPKWLAMAAAWRAMKASFQVDRRSMHCETGAPKTKYANVNTAYMGLVWEEFEPGLNVEAKVRNTVKGDSQTRLAGMLNSGTEEVEVKTEWDNIEARR